MGHWRHPATYPQTDGHEYDNTRATPAPLPRRPRTDVLAHAHGHEHGTRACLRVEDDELAQPSQPRQVEPADGPEGVQVGQHQLDLALERQRGGAAAMRQAALLGDGRDFGQAKQLLALGELAREVVVDGEPAGRDALLHRWQRLGARLDRGDELAQRRVALEAHGVLDRKEAQLAVEDDTALRQGRE